MKDSIEFKAIMCGAILSMVIIIIINGKTLQDISKTLDNINKSYPNTDKNYTWIDNKTELDKYGYGETNIGTSGLHYWQTHPLLDSGGYMSYESGEPTGWEVTIVVDESQQTEYLIFKDTETGNIAAVERRKWEEQEPESEKTYVEIPEESKKDKDTKKINIGDLYPDYIKEDKD